MNAKEFFDLKLVPKVAQDPACMQASSVRSKSVAVELEGPRGGFWAFDFDDQGQVTMNPQSSQPDCLIAMKDETFEGLLQGKVNVPMAVAFRKIKVRGDMGTAAKVGVALQKLFKG